MQRWWVWQAYSKYSKNAGNYCHSCSSTNHDISLAIVQLGYTAGYCHTAVVQLLSHVWLFETPWTVARQDYRMNFSFSISPSNEYSGLSSFRMDWLDLPAVQGTLKSFLQHHSSQASILQRSVFCCITYSALIHPHQPAMWVVQQSYFQGWGTLYFILLRLVVVHWLLFSIMGFRLWSAAGEITDNKVWGLK